MPGHPFNARPNNRQNAVMLYYETIALSALSPKRLFCEKWENMLRELLKSVQV